MAFSHEAVLKRRDIFDVDPRKVKIEKGWNPRIDFGDMEELEADIVANGVIEPIKVRNVMGDLYLVDGERRLKCVMSAISKGADIRSVPAMIARRGISDVESLFLALSSNKGKPLLPSEETAAYQRFKAWGVPVSEIARRVGKTDVHIYNRLKMVDAAPEVKEAVDKKEVGVVQGRKIVQESAGDMKRQKEKLEKIKQRRKDDEESEAPRKAMPRGKLQDVFEEVYGIPSTGDRTKDAFRKGICVGLYMAINNITDYHAAQEAYKADGFKGIA